MDIILVTTVIASLFVVIGLAEPLAARLRLPFSVILAVVGILIGASAIFFLRTDLTDALNPVAAAILGLPIRSNVFLYVFLPTLLFQATLGMNLRRMVDDWVPILVLAVVWNLGRAGHYDSDNHWPVEGAVKYWHFVDLMWVAIYPTLYLFGGS